MEDFLVIGIGNPDRGDDGVGRMVARHLAARQIDGVVIREARGEATELLEMLEHAHAVWLVDACQAGATSGTLLRFDLVSDALPQMNFSTSTHGFGLGQAIELSRTFGSLPKYCVLHAVEAEHFDLGAGLSSTVADAAIQVADLIETEIACHR